MKNILALRELVEPHDLTFFAGAPYLYHCHHYNLFHDQTVDDVLGDEKGRQVRCAAAQAAFGDLLRGIFRAVGAETPSEKVEIAQSLFAAAGHGRLEMNVDVANRTSSGIGTHLHYGFTWREKYGQRIRRLDPADAVATGYLAALTDLVLGNDPGSTCVSESKCVATRDPRCELVGHQSKHSLPPVMRKEQYWIQLGDTLGGQWEEKISAIADGLQGFVAGVAGDEQGLVPAFGIYATLHLANYYNETAFAAFQEVRQKRPDAVPFVEELLREAGHVCVFNTFGGILLSPEWEAMVGKLEGDPAEIVLGCTAIARGLGFGRWSVHEFEEGKRLVIRTASNYEAPWYVSRYGVDVAPRCYFFQGAALAFAVLAHRVKWKERPALTQPFYDELFRGAGLGWKVTPTRCVTKGDAFSEVVIEATK